MASFRASTRTMALNGLSIPQTRLSTKFRKQRLRYASVTDRAVVENEVNGGYPWQLICPICFMTKFEDPNQMDETARAMYCERCDRSFETTSAGYRDFTLSSGMEDNVYSGDTGLWVGTQLFRRRTVSSIYERGWRQSFAWSGFPGPDKEFEYALDYLRPHYGEAVLDLCCGSGLFTRRFMSCGHFPNVAALDFSENMLKQTLEFIKEDKNLDPSKLELIRADVARLPFKTDSVPAIHAGAAIHCWQSPQLAAAEISRVLKPGGTFVGSTFLDTTAPLGQLLGNDRLVLRLKSLDPVRNTPTIRFWSEAELRDLFASVGLKNFKCHRFFRFILWSVTKS